MWNALTRSTGIVATLLMFAALAWGFFFSARATGQRLRPAWWLDLHNWLGGLALSFTAAHLVCAWADSASGIGLLQMFVPNTANANAWAVTWGVISFYLVAAAVFTTWPRRWKRRSWWRAIHLGSVIGTALAVLHGLQLGSDASSNFLQASVIIIAALAAYPLGLRVFELLGSRNSQLAPRTNSASSDDDLAK